MSQKDYYVFLIMKLLWDHFNIMTLFNSLTCLNISFVEAHVSVDCLYAEIMKLRFFI